MQGFSMRSALLILLATFLLTSTEAQDCEAQIFRGRFRSQSAPSTNAAPPLLYQPANHVGINVPQDLDAKPVFPVEDYFPKQSRISRILDGPMTHKYRNPAEVDARYVGGHHQSYFHNLGIPSGDIGIRGNSYKWNLFQ